MKNVIFYGLILLVSFVLTTLFSKFFILIPFLFCLCAFIEHQQFGDIIGGISLLTCIPFKKIYSEWGEFYIIIRYSKSTHHKVYIIQDKTFYYKLIDWQHFYENDNLESLIKKIDKSLSDKFSYSKKISDDIKNKSSMIKSWNGSTTKQIDRDQKLDKILK
jgi:hypothetical protein